MVILQLMDGYFTKPNGWEDVDYRLISKTHRDILEAKEYKHDVILVLAGGLNEFAQNHQWVINRLDLALALYKQKKRKIICVGGGTYHKPPCLNSLNFVIHESTACAKYLLEAGVDPSDLMREWSSYDTIANAFFTLTNYIIPMEINQVLVITSDFHMPRTMAIFNWIYNLDSKNPKCHVDYLPATSSSIEGVDLIIKARKEREKQSLANLQSTINKIKTLKEFHTWLFNEHKAYNCDLAINIPPLALDENTRATY